MPRNILCIGDNYTIVIRLLVIFCFISFSSSFRLSHQINLILDPFFFVSVSFFEFRRAHVVYSRFGMCLLCDLDKNFSNAFQIPVLNWIRNQQMHRVMNKQPKESQQKELSIHNAHLAKSPHMTCVCISDAFACIC